MIAILFSGQGSQYQQMGYSLCQESEAATSVYATATRILGYNPIQLDDGQLKQTVFAQPAIVTLSLALWHTLLDGWMPPESTVLAGFSLGEYSALNAAGILQADDLLRLVQKRAVLMQEAAEENPGGMAAVIGLSEAVISGILAERKFHDQVYAVNFNAPGQIVLSGRRTALEQCLQVCQDAGARRVVPLAVNGAFHTPLMGKAAEKLVRFASELSFAPAQLPLYSNTDATRLDGQTDWPAYLARHLCGPVRWTDELGKIASDGATAFWELGPGKVLAGLVRKILPDAKVASAADVSQLKALLARE